MPKARSFHLKNYCERVFADLILMKSKLQSHVRELERMSGAEKDLLHGHIAHFRDIMDTIDWKLELLMKACPYEWTPYSYDIEYRAAVPLQKEPIEKEPVAGGYVGG